MRGTRFLVMAVVAFVAGLAAAVLAINRYDAAYSWVMHTSDVRIVITRAMGHAEGIPTCPELRRDADDFARITRDNRVQQARVPGVRASVETACATKDGDPVLAKLTELERTERGLLLERRAKLGGMRKWVLLALLVALIGAGSSIAISIVLQRRSTRAVAESEERFRMLASTSQDLIRIHEPTGAATYVSPSVTELLGYTPEEFLALPPLAIGFPDDMEKLRATLHDIQQPNAQATTLTYRARAKDGSVRWLEAHTNPIRDGRGTLVRFYTSSRDITLRVELAQQLEQAAINDELTGLHNRRGFHLLASQQHRLAVRGKQGLAVVFADLDGLKAINDTLGHQDGDRAIREMGALLRSQFRESDVVARLGGDEFAVLVYGVTSLELELVLARLRAAIAAAPPIGPYPLAASIGCALFVPGMAESLDQLIELADQRMYEAKRARKLLG